MSSVKFHYPKLTTVLEKADISADIQLKI